jgi:predicted nucleic acid-binding protein
MAENPSVYVETTVIGYLTSRIGSDPIVAGHQQSTREFWADARNRFRLVVSRLVIQECSAGDATAAAERLRVLKGIPRLRANSIAVNLTKALLQNGGVPPSQPRDAAHIALAATHGIQYLVTWNFRHIANAARRRDIECICRALECEPPLICSPDSFLLRNDHVV